MLPTRLQDSAAQQQRAVTIEGKRKRGEKSESVCCASRGQDLPKPVTAGGSGTEGGRTRRERGTGKRESQGGERRSETRWKEVLHVCLLGRLPKLPERLTKRN